LQGLQRTKVSIYFYFNQTSFQTLVDKYKD
jgi:hypothetical protein